MPTDLAVKERPLIRTAEQVRAIQRGATQFRVPVKPPPPPESEWHEGSHLFMLKGSRLGVIRTCPLGVPGDRFYVKEDLRRSDSDLVTYAADDVRVMVDGKTQTWHWSRPRLSGRFMPHVYSRLMREITDVRVQRIQDISEEDAITEGIRYGAPAGCMDGWRIESGELAGSYCGSACGAFAATWDITNLKRGHGWGANGWVWAYTHRRIDHV